MAMATRGARRHLVTVQNPPAPVSNGDGSVGYPEPWVDLDPPTLYVSLRPATPADMERIRPGTTSAIAALLMTSDYHPQVTSETRVGLNGRLYAIVGYASPDLRDVELECLLVGLVP